VLVATNIEGSFMHTYRFGAILCSVTITTVPVDTIAQTNRDSARSGRKGYQ
jgi:hypothetical protein